MQVTAASAHEYSLIWTWPMRLSI